jgi:hypothetical protein
MIKEEDKKKFKKKANKYVEGKGRLKVKWLKLPEINESFLESGTDIKLTEDLCKNLYPFKQGTSDEQKFRTLAVLRFSCLLGGMDESSTEVKTITEWIRKLLLFSEELRKKCGIRGWSFWEIIEN